MYPTYILLAIVPLLYYLFPRGLDDVLPLQAIFEHEWDLLYYSCEKKKKKRSTCDIRWMMPRDTGRDLFYSLSPHPPLELYPPLTTGGTSRLGCCPTRGLNSPTQKCEPNLNFVWEEKSLKPPYTSTTRCKLTLVPESPSGTYISFYCKPQFVAFCSCIFYYYYYFFFEDQERACMWERGCVSRFHWLQDNLYGRFHFHCLSFSFLLSIPPCRKTRRPHQSSMIHWTKGSL